MGKYRDEDDARMLRDFLLWLIDRGEIDRPAEVLVTDDDETIKSFLADRKAKSGGR